MESIITVLLFQSNVWNELVLLSKQVRLVMKYTSKTLSLYKLNADCLTESVLSFGSQLLASCTPPSNCDLILFLVNSGIE